MDQLTKDYWEGTGANALVRILGYLQRKQCDVFWSDRVLADEWYEYGIRQVVCLIAKDHGLAVL